MGAFDCSNFPSDSILENLSYKHAANAGSLPDVPIIQKTQDGRARVFKVKAWMSFNAITMGEDSKSLEQYAYISGDFHKIDSFIWMVK